MLQPIIQPPDLTTLEQHIYDYRSQQVKSDPSPTVFGASSDDLVYPSKNEFGRTEPEYIGKNEVKTPDIIKRLYLSSSYSQKYIDLNRKSMLGKLSTELSEWSTKDNMQTIPHIINIKRLIEEYSDYLEQSPDTRLLLGALELIFENNEWEHMPEQKILFLKSKIDHMTDNKLNFNQIQTFLRELHTSKIQVLKQDHEEESKKKEEN